MPSNTDNITLVAPRPVRLSNFSIHLPSPHRQHPLRIASTPADPDERLFSADSPIDDDALLHLDPDSKSPKASPRASPRSSLPSEALEEFLSILRPSLFPPCSPILRPLRYPISSLHDRTLTLPSKPLSGIDNLSVLPRDDSRTPVKQLGAPLSSRAPSLRENEENDVRPETPSKFFSSGPLASPISRIHTRNPFQRHASYETSLVPAPYLPQDRALSPASVALPSPTPSELEF
ncbi:hypothetical protein DFH94DRAFT_748275 [Russula ochroleuca]|uniref:Uncharacterized protein n=1 Tax=Russula ochroleuca TaxID=152965 RepID=A0A9P5MUR4_9AGAM|nr:hypothetical protein DFH94DRAFT_748275 [Russula ochroleuca]